MVSKSLKSRWWLSVAVAISTIAYGCVAQSEGREVIEIAQKYARTHGLGAMEYMKIVREDEKVWVVRGRDSPERSDIYGTHGTYFVVDKATKAVVDTYGVL
jgi:hypothetical protein